MRTLVVALAGAGALAMTVVGAGPLRVYGTGSVQGVMELLAGDLSRQVGLALDFTFGTAGAIRDKVQAGEPADVVVATDLAIDQLATAGKVLRDSRTILGRVGLAVAIREGGRAPNLATPESFTQALLAAASVAYADPAGGATAGTYMAGLVKRLGIADALAPKTVLCANGRDVAQRVASGQVELGLTFVSEFKPVRGVTVAAMVPEALQNYTTYVGAIPTISADPAAARAFLRALTSPDGRARLQAAGFSAADTP